MDNSLLTSKYIQAILEDNEEVKAIIGDDEHKIFPLLQPDTITYPYIVHGRIGITTTYTKDFHWYNMVQFSIKCVSNDYIECLTLANAVRHALETYRLQNEEICIHPIQLLSVTEYTTQDNEFVEDLQIQMMVE